MMSTEQYNLIETVTVVNGPKRFLCAGLWAEFVADSAPDIDRSRPSPSILGTALHLVITENLMHGSEDTFDCLANGPVLKKPQSSRTSRTRSDLPTRLEYLIQNQMAGIPALVKDALIEIIGDGDRTTESSAHLNVITAIQTIVDWAVAKANQVFSFNTALKQTVRNNVHEPHALNAAATRVLDLRPV